MSSGLPSVRIVGDRHGRSAFQVVNRRWAQGLAALGHRVVDAAERHADVAVVQDWTTAFGPPPGRRDGTAVAVRPWDFGPYPPRWVEVIDAAYDELWVHSQWTHDLAVAGGVDPSRIRTIALGVDADAFDPEGPVHPMADPTRTTFVFLGAAVLRKGIDVLLDAWPLAFAPDASVQLVVKDHADGAFYEGQDHRRAVQDLAADRPEQVRLVTDHLDEPALASLLRGAQALVLPSRAEGFGLPVLEAMACGVAPVVPAVGALAELAGGAAWPVEVRVIDLPVAREMAYNARGAAERVTGVRFVEPTADRLADALRSVAAAPPEEHRRRSVIARDRARQRSWGASVAAVSAALVELADR